MLIRRIASVLAPLSPPTVLRPIRVRRHRILKEGELERYVSLASARVEEGGGILILLDANGDCPARIGPAIVERARAVGFGRPIEAVLANMRVRGLVACSGRVDRRDARDSSGDIGPAGAGVDPWGQGVDRQPDAGLLSADRRPGGVDGWLRYGGGAPPFRILRQDVAGNGRVAAVGLWNPDGASLIFVSVPRPCVLGAAARAAFVQTEASLDA